jgi:hypothetical protein
MIVTDRPGLRLLREDRDLWRFTQLGSRGDNPGASPQVRFSLDSVEKVGEVVRERNV